MNANSPSLPNERIDALDGLRAVACLAVLAFHFFCRWTPPNNPENLYPYGGLFENFWPFKYGYMGVQLFFIISGYVISMTLFRCKNFREFAVRRFARLFPAMLLCSTVTFFVLEISPNKIWAASAANFLPSLTFIDPDLWNRVIGPHFGWMDGSYWSLFVEIRFYFISAFVYFVGGRSQFQRNILIFLNATLVAYLITSFRPHTPGLDLLFFPKYSPWLLLGVGLFLQKNEGPKQILLALIVEAVVICLTVSWRQGGPQELYAGALVIAAFATVIYKPAWMKFLGNSNITKIGAASYGLYLIHQSVGVTLISLLARQFQIEGSVSALLAILVIAVLIGFAIFIYNFVEIPARQLITRNANWNS